MSNEAGAMPRGKKMLFFVIGPPFLNGQSIFLGKFLGSLGGSLFVVNTADL